MKIFVAGASGVIGIRLIRLLADGGHTVAGMTRTPANGVVIEQAGAQAVICDVYDRPELTRAVVEFGPETVIHQLTDLPDDLADMAVAGRRNARMRREGTRNLIDAATAAGATRLLAQSVAWEPAGDGALAKAELEQAVLAVGGVSRRSRRARRS